MDLGLFTTWNAMYQGGKLQEAEACKQNFKEIDHF